MRDRDYEGQDYEGQTKRTPVKTGLVCIVCFPHGVLFVCPELSEENGLAKISVLGSRGEGHQGRPCAQGDSCRQNSINSGEYVSCHWITARQDSRPE
jgi:hypothetical protein